MTRRWPSGKTRLSRWLAITIIVGAVFSAPAEPASAHVTDKQLPLLLIQRSRLAPLAGRPAHRLGADGSPVPFQRFALAPAGTVPSLLLLIFALGVLGTGVVSLRSSQKRRGKAPDHTPDAGRCQNLRKHSGPVQPVRSRAGMRLYYSRGTIEFRPIWMLGYACERVRADRVSCDLTRQSEQIASECERRGLTLLEIVRESEPDEERALQRPGLGYALRRISAGEANGLVVAEMSRLTESVSELGRVLEWFSDSEARFVAGAPCLDTANKDSQLAVRTIIEVARW